MTQVEKICEKGKFSVKLKMHELKITDKENYGSGKCRNGK